MDLLFCCSVLGAVVARRSVSQFCNLEALQVQAQAASGIES